MVVPSTATITINAYPAGYDNTQRNEIVRGTISVTSGAYPSGGYALTWNQDGIKSLGPGGSPPLYPFPIDVTFKSIASPPSGYNYLWDGTTGALRVYNLGVSPPVFAEISGTVPAAVSGDTIAFTAYFSRN